MLAPGCSVPAVDRDIARAAADFRSLADVPGDLFRQLGQRLDEQGALARFPEVLEEMAKVRAEVGAPALVAPIGQVVATQAVLNVIYGARWQVVPDEMKALLRGEYGTLPAPAAPGDSHGPCSAKRRKRIVERRPRRRPPSTTSGSLGGTRRD